MGRSLSKDTARVLLIIFVFTSLSCSTKKAVEISEKFLPKNYVAYQTKTTPTIDGDYKEAAWTAVEWSDDFIDIEGVKAPKYKTQLKMMWDQDHLYFLAKLEEPHIWGNLKQRDTIIFYNNDIELFIDPDGDTHDYMEIEVNALNTVWDLFLDRPYRNGGSADIRWNIQGLKTAVAFNGSLNNPIDIDKYWTVEIAIPWAGLTKGNPSGKIPVNDFWRMNFSRVHWDHDITNGKYSRKKDSSGNFLREYNWVWSSQGVINMHHPEKWGYVYFAETLEGQKITPPQPKDVELIQWMYCIYRVWLETSNKKSSSEQCAPLFDKDTALAMKKINGEPYWMATSPNTKITYSIRSDGKLITDKASKTE